MNSPPSRNQRLWNYFSDYLPWFIAGALCLIVTNVLGLAIPKQLGDAVQKMRDAGMTEFATLLPEIQSHGFAIIGLAVGAGIARVFSRILIFNAGRFVEFDLRNELYDNLTRLTPDWFASIPTGDLTSRVTNDVNFVRLLFAIPFLHIINTVLAYGIALNKMVGLSWELTLWCLAPFPPLLLVVRQIVRSLFDQTKVVQAQLSDLSSKVQENLTGVAVVKAYGLHDREIDEYGQMNESFLSKNMRLVTLRGGLQSTMTLISGIGTLIVLLVGSKMVLDGQLKLGQFIEFNGYVVALAFPTLAMGWVFSVWNRGQAAFDRVTRILDASPTVQEVDSPATLPSDTGQPLGAIEFENVSFEYEDERALHSISMSIPAGSTVAIVGRTGAGKTTLANLMTRLYDPTEGSIRIDGIPLKELALRETRSEMGCVPQEPFLFSMTIGQNIRFGLDALEYDDTLERNVPGRRLRSPHNAANDQTERIRDAVTIAGLETDIEAFPEGLDTLVGERGITLSGGQKQRVTLARALVMDPRILILDDALASVDTRTEKLILDHLESIMENRTSIIITHRFNALSRVDKIFVVDQGRIVESGTHSELCERKGVYAELYEHQKLREELES